MMMPVRQSTSWLLYCSIGVMLLKAVSGYQTVVPTRISTVRFGNRVCRSGWGMNQQHSHLPVITTTHSRDVTCRMSSINNGSSKKNDKEEEPLTPEKVAELIEVSFVNGVMQLAQGYVDVLKLLVAAIQAGYALGMTPGNLLDTVGECPEQSANRPLMDEEVTLRTTWIQVVYLVLDHVKYKNKNLADLHLTNNHRDGDDGLDEAVRETYAGAIAIIKQAKEDGATFEAEKFRELCSSALPDTSSLDPLETAILLQSLRVIWLTFVALEEEAQCEEDKAPYKGQEQQKPSPSPLPLPEGIRLNKVFKATHSRRQADALIESGRVAVNGEPVQERGGFKVIPFVDRISLDGKDIEGWEAMNGIFNDNNVSKDNTKQRPADNNNNNNVFEYIKYWKPRGITCTTDQTIHLNIIDDLEQRGYQPKHRVYPVGRLDKDTSGLILLTSDGRLPNASLRGKFKQPKQYHVLVDRPLRNVDVQQLRDGVVITTVAQRDGLNRRKALTAPTLPAKVERIPGTQQRGVAITLVEGRNRQIRKMMGELQYEVVELQRVAFMGITLDRLQRDGDWTTLDNAEMELVRNVLRQQEDDDIVESSDWPSKARPPIPGAFFD